jgi:pyridoxal phosphate enzyme (YggS family)
MIYDNLISIRREIGEASRRFNRGSEDVQLLAVSKTRPIVDILTAMKHGQFRFGESYLQEAIEKIRALESYSLEWHFIGSLQSNKTRLIARHFDWVQSLDSLKYAQHLNKQRPTSLPPLNVCIQVNISEERQKAGVSLAELQSLINEVLELPRLRLRGLMTLPARCSDFVEQCGAFHKLSIVYKELQYSGIVLDTLSMGMTDDMVAAIAEGATLVRVGTGIFGKRLSN